MERNKLYKHLSYNICQRNKNNQTTAWFLISVLFIFALFRSILLFQYNKNRLLGKYKKQVYWPCSLRGRASATQAASVVAMETTSPVVMTTAASDATFGWELAASASALAQIARPPLVTNQPSASTVVCWTESKTGWLKIDLYIKSPP